MEVREGLWRSLAPLRERTEGVRWVPPDRYHVTLRFMGDVPAKTRSRLIEASRILEREAAFKATFTRTGTFPRRGAPRIHWVGLRADPWLHIRDRLDDALRLEGIFRERRTFDPHLTVGRAGHVRAATRTAGRVRSRVEGEFPEGFRVEAVFLVRSELLPHGPRYTNLHKVVLAGE